jgi:hypothetical protein
LKLLLLLLLLVMLGGCAKGRRVHMDLFHNGINLLLLPLAQSSDFSESQDVRHV